MVSRSKPHTDRSPETIRNMRSYYGDHQLLSESRDVRLHMPPAQRESRDRPWWSDVATLATVISAAAGVAMLVVYLVAQRAGIS